MSDFDPDTFMSQTVEGELSTQIVQCPEGEYRAVIDDFDSKAFRQVDTKNGPRTIFRVPYVIQDSAVEATLGRDKVVVNQDIWLDFDSNGNLDTASGKNVDLGRVREALGQNKPGAWSFANLRGAGPIMVKVTHRANKQNDGEFFAEIKRVTAIR